MITDSRQHTSVAPYFTLIYVPQATSSVTSSVKFGGPERTASILEACSLLEREIVVNSPLCIDR